MRVGILPQVSVA